MARLFAKVIGNPALMRELTRVGMRSRTLMDWVLRIMANLLRDDELGPAEVVYRIGRPARPRHPRTHRLTPVRLSARLRPAHRTDRCVGSVRRGRWTAAASAAISTMRSRMSSRWVVPGNMTS